MASGDVINDGSEILLRNIHPSWMDRGKPTSQAFRPMPKDAGQLSVDRGSKCLPLAAFELHVSKVDQVGERLRSAGVYGLSVGECAECGLPSVDDPLTGIVGQVDNPNHAYIDFRSVELKVYEKTSKKLKALALQRGVLYEPTE